MAKSTTPIERRELYRTDATGRLKSRRYRLTVLTGPDAGKSFELRGTAVAGTHLGIEVELTDETVSRRHAELTVRPDGVLVRDLKSTNGVFVRGVRITEAVVQVEPEAIVLLGKTRLRLVAEEEDVELTGAAHKQSFGLLLGESNVMRELFGVLERVANNETSILLLGETGTGKSLVAECIHQASERRKGPFVVVDCSTLAGELIESELFGHVRGAFTGADSGRRGLFEQADGGTLFLDEVGELPLKLQPMLLRALETQSVKPVGGNEAIAVDVRIIAATNQHLAFKVSRDEFRKDLYYRLAVVSLEVPALRLRAGDIALLAHSFIRQLQREDFEFSPALMKRFNDYDWPGNVRELRNAIVRVLAGEDAALRPPGRPLQPSHPGVEELPFHEAKDALFESFTREYVKALAEKYNGNMSKMAQSAHLARTYLHRLVRRFGIKVKRDE